MDIAGGFGRHLVNMCGDHNTCGWTSILYQTHPEFQKTLEHSRKCSKLLPVFETRKALFDQIEDESVKFLPEPEQPLQEQSAQTFSTPPSQKIAKTHHTRTALKAREPQEETTPHQDLLSRIHNVCSELYTIPDGTQAFSELIDHIYDLLKRDSLPLELFIKILKILSTFTPSEHLTKIIIEALTHEIIDVPFFNELRSPTTDPAKAFQTILERCEKIKKFAYPYLTKILRSFGDRGEKSRYTKEDLKKQQETLTRFHKVFCAPEVESFEEMKKFLFEHLEPSYQLIESIPQFLTEIETEKTNFINLLGEIDKLKREVISAKSQQQSLPIKRTLTQRDIDFLPMNNEFLPTISQFLRKTIVLVECYSEGRGFEIFFPGNNRLSIHVDDFDLSWEEFCISRHWDNLLGKFNPKKKILDILGELLEDPQTI